MKHFYFTYGSEGMDYYGGWTEVIAKDKAQAIKLFNAVHELSASGCINCAFVYSEEDFKNTSMYKNGNNLGFALHECIELKVIK